MASPRARDGGSEAASRKGGVDLRIAARIDEKVDVLPSSKRGSEAYVALPVAVADAEFLQAIEEVTDDLLSWHALFCRRLHWQEIFLDHTATGSGPYILPRKALAIRSDRKASCRDRVCQYV